GRLEQGRLAALAGHDGRASRPAHVEVTEEPLAGAEADGQVNQQARLERLLRPADDGRLALDQRLADQPLQLVLPLRELGRGDEPERGFPRFGVGVYLAVAVPVFGRLVGVAALVLGVFVGGRAAAVATPEEGVLGGLPGAAVPAGHATPPFTARRPSRLEI